MFSLTSDPLLTYLHTYLIDFTIYRPCKILLNLILAKVREQKRNALAVASSGIAGTLLEGGLTAHAAFKLPQIQCQPVTLASEAILPYSCKNVNLRYKKFFAACRIASLNLRNFLKSQVPI